MTMSTRYTLALHILTLLASRPGEPTASEFIAGSLNTNPAFVRRLMGTLRRAGLVASQPGNGGGWRLEVDPRRLTLGKVRQVLDEGHIFPMHTQQPNPRCPVGRHIQSSLETIYSRAERAMQAELDKTTIASLLRSVEAKTRG